MNLPKVIGRLGIGSLIVVANWLAAPADNLKAANCGAGGSGCGTCSFACGPDNCIMVFTCCSPNFSPKWTFCSVNSDGSCNLGELCS